MKKNILYLVLILIFASFNANAQNPVGEYNSLVSNNASTKKVLSPVVPAPKPVDVISRYSNEIKRIQSNIETSRADRASITDTINTLDEIKAIAKTQISDLEGEVEYINKNLEAIGPKPENGEEEGDGIAKIRSEINKEYSETKAKIAEIQIFITKILEIEDKLLQYRNKALINNLFSRQPSLLTPQVIIDAVRGFFRFTMDIISSPKTWYDDLNERDKRLIKMNIFPVLLILILAYLVGRYLQTILIKKFGYKEEIEEPSYSRKFFASIFISISYGIIPATIICAFLLWLSAPDVVVNGFFSMVLNGLLFYILFVVLIRAFSRAVCCPYNEKWRLVGFSNEKAKKVYSSINITAVIVGVTYYLEYLVLEAGYTLELQSLLVTSFVVLKSFCIIWLTKSIFWQASDDIEISEDDEDDDERRLSKAVKALFFIGPILFTSVVMSLVGYTILSAFILDRILLSALVIGLLFLIEAACDEMIVRLMRRKFWTRKLKLRKKVIKKTQLVLTVTNDPIFVLLGLFILLPIWGVPNELIKVGVVKLFTGFSVGGVTISLIDITLSIAVFFASITAVKVMKTRLVENVLSQMDIDDGIKHSLVSGFGFLGFILATTMAIAVVGIDLTNLALIAGALSFGIGLGLQNVVNNFVSGLIILFERPIKVGDWVVINGQEGIVKQINIRATELETWTKSNIIIPNADILSNPVMNYTHDDKYGRVDVPVGVAYGSDVEKVKEILLRVAADHKKILKKPEPYVLFQEFGDSSLNFELRAFTGDVMNRLIVGTDLRFEVDRIFREENIEIPFPQRVVHMMK